MAAFLSLPNELVCRILSFVLPADIENFANCCRHVFSCSGPTLKKHRALIQKYHKYASDNSQNSISRLLLDILREPWKAHYVRNLTLVEYDIELQEKYSSEEAALLCKAVEDDSTVRQAIPSFNKSDPQLFEYGEPACIAILLTLLPNLTRIDLDPTALFYGEVLELIERFSLYVEPQKFLTRLRKVVFEPGPRNSNDTGYYPVDYIQQFSAIPSVRMISVDSLRAHDGDPMQDDLLPQSSHVTHLELWDSFIGPKTFFDFIRGFTHLESIQYYATPMKQSASSPSLVRSGLEISARDTLRFATILMPGFERTNRLGSLLEFRKLEYLETDWELLIPSNMASRWCSSTMPKSLLGILIHDRKYRSLHEYQGAVDEVAYTKECQKLPHLHHLEFKGPSQIKEPVNPDMKQLCAAQGVRLVYTTINFKDLTVEDLSQKFARSCS